MKCNTKYLVLFTLTACALVYFGFKYIVLTLDVAEALGQVQHFQIIFSQAHDGDNQEMIACLKDILEYYPSGTKHAPGSLTDKIVESSRTTTIIAILYDLKRKTGKDLGSDPELWIKEFKMVE